MSKVNLSITIDEDLARKYVVFIPFDQAKKELGL